MTDELRERLRAPGQVQPPPDMRVRVLAAASPLLQPNDSRLDRLWFSRTWRTAAVLALVAIAGLEAVSNRFVLPAPQVVQRVPGNPAEITELAALELGLSPDDAAALSRQAIQTPPSPAPPPDITSIF